LEIGKDLLAKIFADFQRAKVWLRQEASRFQQFPPIIGLEL
jgi:hypothetical protein